MWKYRPRVKARPQRDPQQQSSQQFGFTAHFSFFLVSIPYPLNTCWLNYWVHIGICYKLQCYYCSSLAQMLASDDLQDTTLAYLGVSPARAGYLWKSAPPWACIDTLTWLGINPKTCSLKVDKDNRNWTALVSLERSRFIQSNQVEASYLQQ